MLTIDYIFPTIVADTVGAGDVFLAGLVYSLCNICSEEFGNIKGILNINSVVAACSEAELAAYASTKFIGTLNTVDQEVIETIDHSASFETRLEENKIYIKHFN